MIEKIVRKDRELVVTDKRGSLEIAFYQLKRGLLTPELSNKICLKGSDVGFFAAQLLDPGVLDPTGKVDLKEPYPFIIRVRWDNLHRILSFIPWEKGETAESIRLSPLEAYRIGQLARNTLLVDHLVRRLKKELGRVNCFAEVQ